MSETTVRATHMAAGGDAIARGDDGRVVFVDGALPGETVRVTLIEEKSGFARGRLLEVIDPSPQRVAPPCPAIEAGCGGCNWQHVARTAQLELKRDIVSDSLRRIARIDDPPEMRLIAITDDAQRTTARVGVLAGRAAFHKRHSDELVGVTDCLVAHPLVAEVLEAGRFPAANEVVVRAGAATGERLVVTSPRRSGVQVPDDVLVVSDQEARTGHPAAVHEVIRGRTWRVSALSFFQSGPAAAEALTGAVVAIAQQLTDGSGLGTVADLYAGVGLLGGATLDAGIGTRLVAIESDAFAVGDARSNLRDLPAAVVRREVAKWRPQEKDIGLVIADPARTGLGKPGAATVAATLAPHVVLVSCDPASFGRDTALLAESGYRLTALAVVDVFPHTSHVEVVAGYTAYHSL
jgi:23S rRNA (uracil1939-C5)-methyltransferase